MQEMRKLLKVIDQKEPKIRFADLEKNPTMNTMKLNYHNGIP